MSTCPSPMPDREGDDWMALADAVGATSPAQRPGAAAEWTARPVDDSLRHEFTDAALDITLGNWARAQAVHDAARDSDRSRYYACAACEDTGLVLHRHWFTGHVHAITCRACGGDPR